MILRRDARKLGENVLRSSTRSAIIVLCSALWLIMRCTQQPISDSSNPKQIPGSNNVDAAASVLSSRGVELPIPLHVTKHTVPYDVHLQLRIVTDESILAVPRADGDEAMQYIIDELDIGTKCQRDSRENWVVVDVGGLFGDFGLSTAARGCPTVIFEPQLHHAQQIAESIVLNKLHDRAQVHHAAVSMADYVSIATGAEGTVSVVSAATNKGAADSSSTTNTRIPTEQLDRVFSNSPDVKIIFLKVDVEGNEDEVWATAADLFRKRKILHAVFEYTPKQFEGRGTDYKTFLPRLYETAKACYVLHRKKQKIFYISPDLSQVFYSTMFESSLQTDIYCCFEENDIFREKVPAWTIQTRLQ